MSRRASPSADRRETPTKPEKVVGYVPRMYTNVQRLREQLGAATATPSLSCLINLDLMGTLCRTR